MSGPKTGRYRLTLEHKLIMKERRERHLMLTDTYRQISEYSEEIKAMLPQVDLFLQQCEEIADFVGKAKDRHAQSRTMKARAAEELNKVAGLDIVDGLDKITAKKNVIEAFYLELQGFCLELEEQRKILFADFHKDVADKIQKGMAMNFDALGQEYRYRIEALLEEAGQMSLSARLKDKKKQIVEEIAGSSSEDFLKTYYSLTVLPFIKACRSYQQDEALIGKQWKELYRLHVILAQEVGEEPLSIECSKEAMEQIAEANIRLQKMLEHSEEQEYIISSVNAVMEEMGYPVIGYRDVTKKSGKKFRNELYEFSDSTAVCVTTGDDGQITMELGKSDTQDRPPTARESAQLCEEMEDFCQDFAEIRKRLSGRGIIADDLSMLPADEQFAQIINTEDYQIRSGYVAQTGRERVRSSRKAMRAAMQGGSNEEI